MFVFILDFAIFIPRRKSKQQVVKSRTVKQTERSVTCL